jgi:hypothetical protein
MQIRFKRFLSIDSPKAIKAAGFGFLNGINYGAPHKLAGVGNMCAHASAGCIKLCLGVESGQAAMHKPGELNSVLKSRIAKTEYFMTDRSGFMVEFSYHAAKLIRSAQDSGLGSCIRPNGSWDQRFEGIPVPVDSTLAERLSGILRRPIAAGRYKNLMALFSEAQWVDYTKNPYRFNKPLPPNYHLTFSLSETNESTARAILASGFNVAAVFSDGLPDTYLGRPVHNGDSHDLRFLDPKGCVIGLSPKGRAAKRDQSGFVIRNYNARNN